MNIGSITLKNNLVFAPLAGITNLPHRLLAKEAGCGLVCSEMISAKGLIYGAQKTIKMLDSAPDEKPLSVQIFGAEPSVMADAAAIAESYGADILDLNFGCPVKKVIKTGAGAALMKDGTRAIQIIKAVKNSIKIPLTIKIRSVWDDSGEQAVLISKIAQDNGVEAIAIHPRSVKQGFTGKADWSLILRLKLELKIPVIGNGDIICPEDAVSMLNQTKCDAVMIGRAAIGNPFIFSQILALINGKEKPMPDYKHRFEIMIRYLDAAITYLGEKNACYMMRSRLAWFSKGLSFSSQFRQSLNNISSKEEAMELITSYRKKLEEKI